MPGAFGIVLRGYWGKWKRLAKEYVRVGGREIACKTRRRTRKKGTYSIREYFVSLLPPEIPFLASKWKDQVSR